MNIEKFKDILNKYYSNPCNTLKYCVAVDFDHTLCDSHYPLCGDEIKPVCDFIREIQKLDCVLILTTCREGDSLGKAKRWLEEHNLHFDYFNENAPSRISHYLDCRKIFSNILFDDTSYNFDINDFV